MHDDHDFIPRTHARLKQLLFPNPSPPTASSSLPSPPSSSSSLSSSSFSSSSSSLSSSLSSSSSLSPSQRAHLLRRYEVLDTFLSSIPNIVHMMKTDPIPDNFHLIHYLSVLSVAKNCRPHKILFYSSVEPSSPWWMKAKPFVQFVLASPPSQLGGKPLRLASHQSDAWRTSLLREQGGIYMDWDVICLRSFLPLLDNFAVIAREKHVPHFREVTGSAVVLSRPSSSFISAWAEAMEVEYDPSCYACHAIVASHRIALASPQLVRVLDYPSFYSPGWDNLTFLFDPRSPQEPDPSASAFRNSYAIHLFESHENYQKWAHTLTSLKQISSVETNFNRIVRKLLKRKSCGIRSSQDHSIFI